MDQMGGWILRVRSGGRAVERFCAHARGSQREGRYAAFTLSFHSAPVKRAAESTRAGAGAGRRKWETQHAAWRQRRSRSGSMAGAARTHYEPVIARGNDAQSDDALDTLEQHGGIKGLGEVARG